MNRKIKSVSFNLDDPMELEMYEHTQKFSSFSTFIKRLIQNSLNGGTVEVREKKVKPSNVNVVSPILNKDLIRQLI